MATVDFLKEVTGSYDRLTEDELANLGIVLGAYRSFRGNRRKHISYVSMPITSGKRFYDVLFEEGVRTVDELTAKCGKTALWERVIQPNIAEGIAFADSLGKREDLLFIAPSVFEAKRWRWTQDTYMSLWYRVIGEMAGRHDLMDGWEYSNGGVDEVLFSLYLRWRIFRMSNLQDGIGMFGLKNFLPGMSMQEQQRELQAMWEMRIYDASGNEIRLDSALKKCVDVVYTLRERGLPFDAFLARANQMMLMPFFTPAFYEPDDENGRITDSDCYQEASKRLKRLLKTASH